MIRVLKDFKEKQKTRLLYEQAFSDPAPFVDYYYREKCKDNTMIVQEEDGHLISMLHLNPYTLCVDGVEMPSYYIVAVATDENFRRRGCMRSVLEASFAHMEEEKIAFCFLLPVNEAIYTPFSFETVTPFVARSDPRSSLSYEEVRKRYRVFCVQDALYRKRRTEEDQLALHDACEVLPDQPVMMMRRITGSIILPDTPDAYYFREEV